jgi:hypothetical protein
MANDTLRLEQPLLEDQLAAPFYFNGRVLTQEDLAQDRTAQTTRRRHLGRAGGSGVAFGLEVEAVSGSTGAGNVTLFVAPGIAVAPDGQSLHLPQLVRLRFALAEELVDADDSVGGGFDDCQEVVTVATQTTGLHVLVIRPFTRKQGLAPVSGLGNEAAPCNAKYLAAGVDFRAVPFTTTAAKTSAQFRSRVALECFGFGDATRTNLLANPFAFPAPLELAVGTSDGTQPTSGYGLADDLRRKQHLGTCEVPLAVVFLADDGSLGFVETWSVRRALTRPALSRRWWPFGGSDGRRRAESEAALLQFQDHIGALLLEGGLNRPAMAATARFAFLPGGGFLPTGSGKFTPTTFLGSGVQPVVDADFGRLPTLVEESFHCEPFDPANPPELVYFDFGASAHPWVFFLRRKQEVVNLPTEPAEPGSSPPASDDRPPPPGAVSGLLIAITNANLFDTDDIQVIDSGGKRRPVNPIEPEELLELIERYGFKFASESSLAGRERGRRRSRPTELSPEDVLPKNARFFLRLAEGAQTYRIQVHTPGHIRNVVNATANCPENQLKIVPIG